jgi:hypothetical protein
MYALPPGITRSELRVTGVSCPECSGVLGVRAEGREDSLVFECRVGHTYDVAELLAAKEEMLERRLWVATTALDELIALLGDLVRRETEPAAASTYRRRESEARAHLGALRSVLEANRPVDLSAVEPGHRGDEERPSPGGGGAAA